MAAMERDAIRVTRSVLLPVAEIELRFSRSSGPGGQHANTAETRVEALLDVEASSALTEAQKRASSRRRDRLSGRSRRTSAASYGTASWRSSGSSSSCGRP
jgi:ribosome-associated protein